MLLLIKLIKNLFLYIYFYIYIIFKLKFENFLIVFIRSISYINYYLVITKLQNVFLFIYK